MATLRARARPSYPRQIVGTGAVDVTVANGTATISVDADEIEANFISAVSMGDANYTVTSARTVLTGATLTAARVLTLPAANSRAAGSTINFADQANGVAYDSYVAITRAGTDTINGGTVYNVRVTGAGVVLVTDGVSKWTALAPTHQDWSLRSDRSIYVDGTQVFYFPRNFVDGNFFIGDGGRNLVHTSGLEGYYNLGVGQRCLTSLTTGSYNVFGGLESGDGLTTGSYNTGWGEAVMIYHVTSSYNSAFGWKAGQGKASGGSSGQRNAWFGAFAGGAWQSGDDNAFFGAYAGGTGSTNGTGGRNLGIGSAAGYSITTASGNVLIGSYAGYSVTTGGQNVLIGDQSGNTLATGTNNTIIGSYVDATSASMSNTLIIGTHSRRLIWADGSSAKFLNYANDNATFEAVTVASGASWVVATQATSSTNPNLKASSNNLTLGSTSALATNATGGFVMLPGMAGQPTGAPTGASAAAIVLQPDTTNNTMWMYMNSAWINTRLRTKRISFTRDLSTATGSVAYTGAGFKPTAIIIISGGNGATDYTSVGLADSSLSAGSTSHFGAGVSYASSSIVTVGVSGTNQQATVASFDSDGFTLSWTKNGSPTGTVQFYAICLC